MNSTILTLALLCAGMVLLCNVDQVTGQQYNQQARLCSKNYYYTNWDCRNNCRVCQYRNCNSWDVSCGADYDDDNQVGEGSRGENQGGETSKSEGDEAGGDYGADYDYGRRKRETLHWNQPQLCSTNYYYTNWDCRQNCRVCLYNCNPQDPSCGADYDDGDQVGEGDRGINQGGSETKSDETGGDYGADYDYGK